jgi:hypothetical protein
MAFWEVCFKNKQNQNFFWYICIIDLWTGTEQYFFQHCTLLCQIINIQNCRKTQVIYLNQLINFRNIKYWNLKTKNIQKQTRHWKKPKSKKTLKSFTVHLNFPKCDTQWVNLAIRKSSCKSKWELLLPSLKFLLRYPQEKYIHFIHHI